MVSCRRHLANRLPRKPYKPMKGLKRRTSRHGRVQVGPCPGVPTEFRPCTKVRTCRCGQIPGIVNRAPFDRRHGTHGDRRPAQLGRGSREAKPVGRTILSGAWWFTQRCRKHAKNAGSYSRTVPLGKASNAFLWLGLAFPTAIKDG